MIKISVDEGIAFDMLSILEIKNSNKDIFNFESLIYLLLYGEIAKEIGIKKLEKILKSKEYKDLLFQNKQVFGLVEVAQKDNGLAKMIDAANHQRYVFKTKLQKKFFKNKINEVKIGYK